MKKIIFISFLLTLSIGAHAQLNQYFGYGGQASFVLGNKIGGAGLGPCYSFNTDYTFGYGWQLFTLADLNFSIGSLGYKTADQNGNYTNSKSSLLYIGGVRYTLAVNYYFVPREWSINLGAYGSLGSLVIDGSGKDANADLPVAHTAEGDVSINKILNSSLPYDYGVRVGVIHRNGTNQLGFNVLYGLNNVTGGIAGFNSSIATMLVSYHFNLKNYSLGYKYQNKLHR